MSMLSEEKHLFASFRFFLKTITTYAGVRVIILTPMYFFLAAPLPRDEQQYNTNTIIHPAAV